MSPLFADLTTVLTSRGKTTLRARRTPSPLQQAILNAIEARCGNLLIEATAGSGKTSLLEMIAEQLIELGWLDGTGRALFLAFSKDIVKELQTRLPQQVTIRTINSLGYLICREQLPSCDFQPKKYEVLLRDAVGNRRYSRQVAAQVHERLDACVRITMSHLLPLGIDRASWCQTMDEFDVPVQGMEDDLYGLTMEVVRRGMSDVAERGIVSFLDQVYAPWFFGWRLKQPFRFLLVDEAQDLSRGQQAVVQAACDERSLVIAVGDASQAVFSFSGSDRHSLRRLGDTFQATRFPLSVTYRCPQRHVALASPYTSVIEAAPGARLGTLDDISGEEFLSLVQPGDLVLCRVNAPLVRWCFRLAQAGRPSHVKGRDVARSLVALARDAATWDGQRSHREQADDALVLHAVTFETQLASLHAFNVARLRAEAERQGRDPDMREANAYDRVKALLVILQEGKPDTLGALTQQIRALFQSGKDSVTLSSVHRAKGLEADRVYILEPDLMPHPSARTEAALEAEHAVLFVAYTRAKRSLLFVDAQDSHIPAGLRGREAQNEANTANQARPLRES
ncbi:UvrD-helicase domain-containing protein [Deinococcus multiflagellatus]|uniref:DNA 3'-5' helicase n=2 Tax=Deinococcus multiflagellatus TaxID=1656887 RepID=A0ABW1ZRZ5_9DEIO